MPGGTASWDGRSLAIVVAAAGAALAALYASAATGLALALAALLVAAASLVATQALSRHPCERGAQPPRLPVDDSVRKQRLTKSKLDAVLAEPLDAIVIGSGMGGLACAAMLSRQGQRVLVLEQHDVAGGSTHTFVDRGFEFDTGLHYIGGPAFGTGDMPSEGTNLLLNSLTDGCAQGPVEWTRMADDYDIAVQGKLRFAMRAGKQALLDLLCLRFADDEAGIKKYFALIEEHQVRKTLTDSFGFPCQFSCGKRSFIP
jgi:all-trans-retinol 13,14-reductase